MTATNHALTGAALAFLISVPAVALPVAFLSHFVCDAIPHYDSNMKNPEWLRSRNFNRLLITDGSLCVVFVAVLAYLHPEHWLLAAVCAFLATSPDLFWINRWWHIRKGLSWKPNLFSRFASVIQWRTGPFGGIIEAAWFIAAVFVLVPFMH
jgi:hypothetical protein